MGTDRVYPVSATFLSSEFLFGRFERWTITVVAFALHSASLLYLLSFAFMYWVVSDDDATVLHFFAPRVQSVVFAVVASLHFRGLYHVVFPCCIDTTPSDRCLQDRPTTWGGTIVYWYRYNFSRYGVFGLHGSLYEMRVTFKQAFQVPSQAYQAYQMSIYLTDPTLCSLYTALLACDCLLVPCFLFSNKEFTRRWGPSFVDAMFDFTLSAGFPLAIIFHAFIDYFVVGRDTLLWNKTWLNQMIMMARFAAVTNVGDMLSTLLPFVTCYTSLSTLHSAVLLRTRDLKLHQEILAQRGAVASRSIKHIDVLLRASRRTFLVASMAAGIFLCSMAGTSVSRDPCPPGCVLQTYPWFTTECNCVMMRLNCKLHALPDNVDVDTFVRRNLSNVFDLAIHQCDVPHGLSQDTLHALQNLYSLELRRTNTIEWNLAPTDLPPSLFTFLFQDQRVPRVPQILQSNVNRLKYIFLGNVSTTDPNASLPTYRDLRMLSLINMSLPALPAFVYDMRDIGQIELNHNRLTAFPAHVESFHSLHTLSLVFNSIASIPSTFVQNFPPSLKRMYLDGNPLTALPLETDFALVQSQRLRIRGTPMCDRLYAAVAAHQVATLPELEQKIVSVLDDVCSPDCNLGCHSRIRGTTVCESVCLVPSCDFDSNPSAFAAAGIRASDCYGVVTGWEP